MLKRANPRRPPDPIPDTRLNLLDITEIRTASIPWRTMPVCRNWRAECFHFGPKIKLESVLLHDSVGLHTSLRTADASRELCQAVSSTLQPRHVTIKLASYWSTDGCYSRTEFRNADAVIEKVIMGPPTGPEELLTVNTGSYFQAA